MKKPCLRDELKQGVRCAVIKLFQMTSRHRHRRLLNGLQPNQGYRRQSDLQANLAI